MNNWQKAAQVLQSGGVVILPSESSFGIAALANDNAAVLKLYSIKDRPENKPSLIIVSSLAQAKTLVELTPLAEELVNKYWPGPLTLVLKAKNTNLSSLIYGQDQTLAIRFPKKDQLIKLVEDSGPFIFPSANLSGQPAPFSLEEIDSELKSKVDFVVEEPTEGNDFSTLVDARGKTPVILREGAVKVTV